MSQLTSAALLYLEGGCGFLVGYSLALSQVTGRPQSSYCLECRAGGEKSWEDLHAAFGVVCLWCSVTMSIPFPSCVSFWELMAIWSSKQGLVELRTSTGTNLGKWRLPDHLLGVTAQQDECLASTKRVVGACIWDRLN